MPTFRGLAAIHTSFGLAALAAVILAGVFTVFRAEATALSEVKKLLASDAQFGDFFGGGVAISGDTAIVGAFLEDAGGSSAGAAYVSVRDQGGPDNWGEVKKLTASDAEAFDEFGYRVAVSGDTAVVGARLEDAGDTDAGAAYVFQRDQGGTDNWGEVKKLTASDAQTDDQFGTSVAISGDTAVVGGGSGAYLFERNQGGPDTWGEVKKLTASDTTDFDAFGVGVAISGATAIVGAFLKDTGANNAGAAYVFQRDQGGAGNWGEVKKLTASDAQANDWFGESVAVGGDTVVVGARFEGSGGSLAGAAYVFQRDQGGTDNWGEVKKLTASDAQAKDNFGISVAISGNRAVAGAHLEGPVGFSGFGAAYVFQRDEGGAGNWGEVQKLTASDAQAGDRFGESVAASGDTAVVGARVENAGGSAAGAAYVFEELAGTLQFSASTYSVAEDAGTFEVTVTRLGGSAGVAVVDLKISDGTAQVGSDYTALSIQSFTWLDGDKADKTATITLINDGDKEGSEFVNLELNNAQGAPLGSPSQVPLVIVDDEAPIGGIAALPEVAGAPLETDGSWGRNAGVLAGGAAVIVASATALVGAAWYARRRWVT